MLKYQRHLKVTVYNLLFAAKRSSVRYTANGTECLYTVDPSTFDDHKKSDKKNSDDKRPVNG